jgi:hypothetical protein
LRPLLKELCDWGANHGKYVAAREKARHKAGARKTLKTL